MAARAGRPPAGTWPPLITDAVQPRWMPWRDRLLTLLMWGVFAVLLITEGELTIAHIHAAIHGVEPEIPANWANYWEQLRPFVLAITLPVAWLCVFALVTARRRRRGIQQPPPDPLDIETQAADAGLTPAALAAARDLRLAVAHIEPAGTYRIEARDQV